MGTATSTHQIVEWAYDNIEEDNFKSKENLRKALLAKDKTGSVEGWIKTNKSDWYTVRPKKAGSYVPSIQDNLKDFVDKKNEEYKQTVINRINKASKQEVSSIKIDDDYEPSTINELRSAIDERADEFVEQIDDIVADIKKQAASAKTTEDLDVNLGKIEKEYGADARKQVSKIISDRQNELESVEERFVKQTKSKIESASTLSELNNISVSEAPTTRAEEELKELIERKKGILGG